MVAFKDEKLLRVITLLWIMLFSMLLLFQLSNQFPLKLNGIVLLICWIIGPILTIKLQSKLGYSLVGTYVFLFVLHPIVLLPFVFRSNYVDNKVNELRHLNQEVSKIHSKSMEKHDKNSMNNKEIEAPSYNKIRSQAKKAEKEAGAALERLTKRKLLLIEIENIEKEISTINNPRVLKYLFSAVNANEAYIRLPVVTALGNYNDPTVIDLLEDMSKNDPSTDVRKKTVEALDNLNGNVREGTTVALGNIG